jgi:hypothetical protein
MPERPFQDEMAQKIRGREQVVVEQAVQERLGAVPGAG